MQGTHLSSTWEIGAELFVNTERVRAGLHGISLKSHGAPAPSWIR
jgi:hypothetical protein